MGSFYVMFLPLIFKIHVFFLCKRCSPFLMLFHLYKGSLSLSTSIQINIHSLQSFSKSQCAFAVNIQGRRLNDAQYHTNQRLSETIEALALLRACENSRLAALTSRNSSTAHLLQPSPSPAAEPARPLPRTMHSATLVRVVSHTTLEAAPAGSLAGQNQRAGQRPPLVSQGSTRSILRTSMRSVPTVGGGTRRSSRVGSAVSWTVPSLSQIGEDGMAHSSETSSPPAPLVGGVQVEEDRVIGGSVVRVRTKLFRRVSFSSGEEEFEEILVGGTGKQVIFVWGEGVDDIIP